MIVAVVAPHPDDEIIGVGGTMYKHIKKGDEVHVILVTRGVSEYYSGEYVKNGRMQQKKANEILGVKHIEYIELTTPTLDTLPHCITVKMIQQTLMEVNPDIVYIPHYGDMHIEHRIVAECCMVALRPKAFKDIEIYGYEVPSETGWNIPSQHNEFIPNVYVKLEDEEVEKKTKALMEFSSQMNEYPSARSVQAIMNLSKYRGATVGTKNAEAFMLIRMQRS